VAGAAAVEATVEVRDIAAARGTPTARPGFSIDIGRLARWWTSRASRASGSRWLWSASRVAAVSAVTILSADRG